MVNALHDLILRLYPGARVDMQFKMPTYHVGAGWVAVASRKRHVFVYTCGAPHTAEFKRRHPEIKTGKGCIDLNPNYPVPPADLEKVEPTPSNIRRVSGRRTRRKRRPRRAGSLLLRRTYD